MVEDSVREGRGTLGFALVANWSAVVPSDQETHVVSRDTLDRELASLGLPPLEPAPYEDTTDIRQAFDETIIRRELARGAPRRAERPSALLWIAALAVVFVMSGGIDASLLLRWLWLA